MSRTPTPKQMACLTIGFQRVLLPADKALAVMSALQHAVDVEMNYRTDLLYEVRSEPLRLSLDLVSAGKISMPAGTAVPQPAAPRTRRIAA